MPPAAFFCANRYSLNAAWQMQEPLVVIKWMPMGLRGLSAVPWHSTGGASTRTPAVGDAGF